MRNEIFYTIGTVILGICIVFPIMNQDSASASRFDVVTFNDILKPDTNIQTPLDNYQDAIDDVQEVVDGMEGLSGIDVESVVGGDFSSVLNQNLTSAEAVSLITRVTAAQQAAYEMKNTVSKVANETAYINQIQNSSFGDSLMDLQAELDAMQQVVSDMNSTTETINNLYRGIDMVMSAKSSFMPEKTDNDYFAVCIDYVPDGVPHLPKLTDGIDFDLSLESYINEDIFNKVKPDITLDRILEKEFQGIADPSYIEAMGGDITGLLEEGMSPFELSEKANIAVSEAYRLRDANLAAERYELEAQSLEHMHLKIHQQMSNFEQQSSRIQKLLTHWEAVIKQFDQLKPPTK